MKQIFFHTSHNLSVSYELKFKQNFNAPINVSYDVTDIQWITLYKKCVMTTPVLTLLREFVTSLVMSVRTI